MCTDFIVVAEDSSVVVGRSMEFAKDLQSGLAIHARGKEHRSIGPGGKPGKTWISQHGYVGLTGLGTPLLTDGLNTAGLSIGALWLPGSTYPKPTEPDKALALVEFVGWVLGTCATVEEVKRHLHDGEVQVWEGDWLAQHLPLHFAIHDRHGHSIVVEYTDRKLCIYDNKVGVLTNDPIFPVHLESLRNYVSLTPYDTESVQLGGLTVHRPGCGTGLIGIPGDSTPPSRFVRTAYLKQFSRPVADAAAASSLAFHLLNAVDIPLGTSRAPKSESAAHPDKPTDDYTQWVVVKDLTSKIFNVRLYDSPLAYSVALDKLDFHALDGKTIALPVGQLSIDITPSRA